MRLLLASVLMLSAAAPAGAASVSLEPAQNDYDQPVATFRAAPGEHNRLTVALGPDSIRHYAYGEVTFTDTGAPLTSGKGCATRSKHVVECTAKRKGVSAIEAYLGDGNDSYRVEGTRDDHSYVRGYGGPGKDRLVGAGFNDELSGGRGDDVVKGGVGNDVIYGGEGRDVIRGGAGYDQIIPGAAVDDIDCGPADEPNQSDEVYGPEEGEALVACRTANIPYPDGKYLSLTPNLDTTSVPGEPHYYIACPQHLDAEGEDPPTCTGTLTLSYEGETIATADKAETGLTDPVFTDAGRELAQRPGGVRATAELVADGQTSRWISLVQIDPGAAGDRVRALVDDVRHQPGAA